MRLDFVLMDVNMPDMDGKIASKKIREIEKLRGNSFCKIIFISANCLQSEIEECLKEDGEIRAVAFWKKPISIQVLKKLKEYQGIS